MSDHMAVSGIIGLVSQMTSSNKKPQIKQSHEENIKQFPEFQHKCSCACWEDDMEGPMNLFGGSANTVLWYLIFSIDPGLGFMVTGSFSGINIFVLK